MKCEPSELVDTSRSVVAPFGRGPGTIETFCSIIEPAPPFSRSPMPGDANSLTSMKLVAALPSTTIAWALPLVIATTSPTATGSWLGKQSFAPQRKCTLISPCEILSTLAGREEIPRARLQRRVAAIHHLEEAVGDGGEERRDRRDSRGRP